MSEPESTVVRPPGGADETRRWARQLTAQLREEQRARWRRGDRLLVEVYLRQHPVLQTDADCVLDLLYNEVLLREQLGEAPQLDEYVRRFPQLATQLRDQFEVHTALESANLFEATTCAGTASLPGSALPPEAAGNLPIVAGYQLLQELGRGGMGVVYLARHLRLKRHVALKMIREGAVAGTEYVARFRTEAEVIARLQHPNIVQIYEVGEHEGRLYLALEYLQGGSLGENLEGMPLPARPAAQLVETLAGAIHYAHQRGIVHRDLKPANILLQREEGERLKEEPEGLLPDSAFLLRPSSFIPKITDFGLAKLLREDPGWSTPGGVMGTPSYMPPEQALGQNDQIGPAADVYALGAILYELITGRPPFMADSHLNTLQQVQSQEPIPPARLQPGLPRDLETICLKCLQKEKHKRYASAQDLAEDLRRFRVGEPIHARPIGLSERTLKWAKRRPTAAALLLVSGLALLILVAGSLFYSRRVSAERDEAVRNFQRARQAVDQMLTEVAEEQLAIEPRMEEKRRRLLEKALAFYREFLDERPTDRSLRLETALAHKRVADILRLLGQHDPAGAAYGQAIALLDELALQQPAEPVYRQQLADSYNFLGEGLRAAGRFELAEEAYHQARRLQEQLCLERPQVPIYQQDLARTYNNLGILSDQTGRLADAEAFLRQALGLLQSLVDSSPEMRPYCQHLARGYLNLGPVLRKSQRLQEAEAKYGQAIRLLQGLKAQDRDNPDYAHELAVSFNNLGNLLAQIQRFGDARTAHEQARNLFQTLAHDFPRVPVYRQELANALNSLGSVLAVDAGLWRTFGSLLHLQGPVGMASAALTGSVQQTYYATAHQAFDQARLHLTELVTAPSRSPAQCRALALTHGNLGWLLTEQDHWAEARSHFAQAIVYLGDALKSNPRHPYNLRALRDQYRDLAETGLRLREPAAAVQAAVAMIQVPRAEELDYYFAACFVARCAALVEQPAHAQEYRTQAMQLLQEAVQKGFKDAARLESDRWLESLRADPSFVKLVTDLKATSPSAAPAAPARP